MTQNSPKRFAVIDLGSNTCRMIVIESVPGYSYRLVDQIREMVRLREGFGPKGLSEGAMDRAIATLRLYKRYCDSSAVDIVIATATSAVRDATNGDGFLERARSESEVSLRVLDGKEEAYYGVVGALNNVALESGWVVDVGGGSAQISRIAGGAFEDGAALPLGALRLTEAYVSSDPMSSKERDAIDVEIKKSLDGLLWLKQRQAGTLVGLGGTIRNLAFMEIARKGLPIDSLHGYSLSRKSVRESVRILTNSNLAKRERITGLNADRADIIASGALVVLGIMKYLKQDELLVSVNGIREGLFFEQFWSHLASPIIPDVRRFGVLNLARTYGYAKRHANHVRYLAGRLFDQLSPLHGCDSAARELLESAALLHDIGTIIGYKGHHHHSSTLIRSNGIPGLSTRETILVALATQYHRKGRPDSSEYSKLLERGDDRLLLYLASILRLAEFLERGRNSVVTDVIVTWTDSEILFTLIADEFPAVELWEARRQAAPLLADVFQREIEIKSLIPMTTIVRRPDSEGDETSSNTNDHDVSDDRHTP